MKKKSLIIGIISLIVLLFVVENDAHDIIRFSDDIIVSFKYEMAGYILALILSIIAFVLAIMSIVKDDKVSLKDKKILISIFMVSVVFMIVSVIVDYNIRMFGFVAIIIGILMIWRVEIKKSEKIKLIIATTLSIIILHESFSSFMQIAWSIDDYKNHTMRFDNSGLEKKIMEL